VEPVYLIIGLVVALLEAVLVYKAIKNTRRARFLGRLPWSKIGQLQPGLVKVQGRALAAGVMLRSPLAGRECVYFHFQVEEKRQRGGGPFPPRGSYWKTVVSDTQDVPWTLDDGTGRAVVRLKSAELDLRAGAQKRSGFGNSARPELEATLQKYGLSSVGLIFNRTLSYRETRIDEGDALVILGTAREVPSGGWELVRGDGPLLISDKRPDELLASYRSAAFLWWCLAVLLAVTAGVAVIGSWL
jgi:hypothetical protein